MEIPETLKRERSYRHKFDRQHREVDAIFRGVPLKPGFQFQPGETDPSSGPIFQKPSGAPKQAPRARSFLAIYLASVPSKRGPKPELSISGPSPVGRSLRSKKDPAVSFDPPKEPFPSSFFSLGSFHRRGLEGRTSLDLVAAPEVPFLPSRPS